MSQPYIQELPRNVYPLERVSGLRFNVDFFVGYSPERINPGDKEHTVEKILKSPLAPL
jgi:UDP-N-acetyl-D-mannosaminuronate dehydrogenase